MMTVRDWLSMAPFTLGMSSGFFGFFAHAGLLSVLEEEGLPPARVCGSSAGALAAGLWAAGLPAWRICDELQSLRRDHFWDPRPGLGLLRGARFRARIEALSPVASLEECRVPAAISLFDVWARRTTVVRQGPIAPVLHASCAAPILFQPVRIGGRVYLDGGILDRPGLDGAGEGERILFHHLPSSSPWRRASSPASKVPRRANMHVVAIAGLPRVDPFHLERGREAMALAQRATRLALSSAVSVEMSSRPR